MPDPDNNKKLIDEMNRYYEARAPWHDDYMSYSSNEKMEALLHPIIRIVEPIVTGKKVLELACGTGNWTQVLAKRAASVTAQDISPTALEIARPKLTGCDNVTFVEGDAYDLGDAGDSFEVLFSADWWSHIPKTQLGTFLDAALARLSSGSTAIFIDMSLISYFESEPCRYDDDGNRVSFRTLPDGTPFEVVKNFPTESELRAVIASFSNKIDYYDFPDLARWMVMFERP